MKTLFIISRLGNYDFAHPDRKQVNYYIQFNDDDDQKICNVNFDEDSDPRFADGYVSAKDVAQIIDDHYDHVWASTAKKKDMAFKKMILSFAAEIDKGNRIERLKLLREKKSEIEDKIKKLNSRRS